VTAGSSSQPGDEPVVAANASGRQLLRNVLTSYLGLVVSLVLSLLLTPIVLRTLGTTKYGLWVAIMSVGSYLTIVDAGVSTATVKEVAHWTAVGDREKLADVLASARTFFAGTAIVSVGLSLVLLPFLGDIFHPGTELGTAKLSMLVMGVGIGMMLMTNTSQAALFGSGRNDRSSLLSTVVSAVAAGGQIAIVLLGGGILGLFVVLAFGSLAGLIGTNIVARRTGVLPQKYPHIKRSTTSRLLRSGGRNAIIAIAGQISYSVDVLTISIILPVRRVTPYDIALSTANLSRSVSTTGTSMLLPAYAHNAALDNHERQFAMYSRAILISLALSLPIVVAIISFGPGLLSLWLGKVPPQTYEVSVALNAVMLLQLPGTQSFLLLIGLGRNGLLARLAVPAAVLNLGLSVAATYWLGPLGPAVGSLPQVVLLEFVALPVICCRVLEVPVRRYIREALAPLLPGAASCVAAAALLLWLFGGHDKIAAPFESVAVSLISWLVFVFVVFRSEPAVAKRLARFRPGRDRRAVGTKDGSS
jgi:O-antigen/teichoic acid export membrane protein